MIGMIQTSAKLVDKEKGLYLFTKHPVATLLSVNMTMHDVYEKHKA
jgi:hypothetical protein